MLRFSVVFALMLATSTAWGAADTFGLGTGRTGPVTINPGAATTVINTYAPVDVAVTAGATFLTVTVGTIVGANATFTGTEPDGGLGDLVLVWQTTGYTGTVVSGSANAIDLTSDPTGQWELARVLTYSSATGKMTFTSPLINSYALGATQVVAVPEYTTLQVNAGKSIIATPWDGTRGGIVAFLANGAVTLNGSVVVDGQGGRGGKVNNATTNLCGCTELDAPSDGGATGALIQKWSQKGEGIVPGRFDGLNGSLLLTRGMGNIGDGAGGGDCDNAGGGGGGNYGVGGQGGNTWSEDSLGSTENPNLCANVAGSVGRQVGGLGGATLTYSLLDHLTYGGGGGAGQSNDNTGTDGAAGGGVIWIRAASLTGGAGSAISANGANAANAEEDGAGGGGAGGSIYFRLNGACSATPLRANGGNGGSTVVTASQGPGGGGGGGRILSESATSTCITSVASGIAGVWFDGNTITATDDGGQDNAGPAAVITNSGNVVVITPTPTVTISSPATNAVVVSGTPTVTGTAEDGSTVTVRDGSVVECVVVASATTGSWSCTPSPALSAGSVTLTATSTDSVGNSSSPVSVTFTVDTTAPAITSPTSGEDVVTSRPTISGTAAPNSTIKVTDAAGTVCTATTSSTGAWSCVAAALAPGSVTITATETDASIDSLASAPVTFTVDTTAPTITSPTAGQSEPTDTPIISGVGAPGDTVKVEQPDGGVLCTTTAGTDGGGWSCVSSVLSDGSHTVVAVDSDTSNDSNTSASVTFTTGEVSPTITAPVDGGELLTGTPIIHGTAEDNSTVSVSDGTTTLCTAQASSTGSWSCTSSLLGNGVYTITASSTDGQGSAHTSGPVTFSVDTTVPTIVDPVSGSTVVTTKPSFSGTAPPGSTVAVTEGTTTVCMALATTTGTWSCTPTTALSSGSHTVIATASDGLGDSLTSASDTFTVDAAAPTVTSPTSGQDIATDTPTITGTAPPGSTVTLTSGTTVLCTVTADPTTGAWTCPVPAGDLSDGPQTITVTATDSEGGTSSTTATFVTDTQPPTLTILTGPAASTNQTTAVFTISEADPAPSSGLATPLCSLDLAPPTACPIVGTTITYLGVSQGNHLLGVAAVDNAGNESAPPAMWSWTVITSPPNAPTITAPAAGQALATATPALSGTAPANDTVTVTTSTGRVLCTTTASGAGTWTCPSASLTDGTYSISATAEDAVGNFSAPSSSVSFTVDTHAPTVAITTGPPSSTASTSATFTVTESDPSPSSGLAAPTCTLNSATIPCNITNTTGSGSSLVLTISLSAVPSGSDTFTVTAVDNAGNSSTPASYPWTVTATAPNPPTITSPTSGQEVSTSTPTITGTAPDGSTVTVTTGTGTVLCTAVASATGAWSCVSTVALEDGSQTISATDTTGGNTSSATSVSVIIDATPPDTIIVTHPPAESNSASATFTFSCNESPVTYQCGLDGAAFAACTTPDLLTGLVDGSHTLQVRAVDTAGNVDPTPASYTWTVDTVAPAAPTFTTPESGSTIDTTTPVVSGTAEPGSAVIVTVAGFPVCTATADANGNWTCVTSPALGQGSNTLSATATDAAGNTGVAGTDTFTVDTVPPTVTIVSGPPSTSSSSSATFTFSSSESPVTYRCTLDSGTPAPCPNPATFGSLADGSHTLSVVAIDAAGNVSTTPATWSWMVDTASTILAITSPGNGSDINTGNPTISGTAPGGTVSVSVNGTVVCAAAVVTNGQWTCPDTGTALSNGPYTITVIGIGTDGGTATVTSSFVVDTTPPTVTFTATPPAVSNSSTALFEFIASEAGCTFECSLDSTAFASCSPPDTLTGLADGSHTFQVKAVDPAGNVGPAISDTWTISTTLPASPVLDSPGNGAFITQTTPTFVGTAPAGDTVTVQVDGTTVCTAVAASDGSWSCTSTTALSLGTHGVELTASNGSGTSPVTDSSFTIETAAPDTTIVSGPPNPSSSSNATFQFSSNESDVTYQCELNDAGAFTPCSNPDALAGLANGDYTLSVEAVNAAGLADPTPATWTWVVNTALGGTFTVTQPANGALINQSLPTFSGSGTAGDTVNVTVDGVLACTTTVLSNGTWSCTATTPESDGQHQVSATSFTGGDAEDGHVDLSFGIDTVPPTTVIISGPPHTGAPSNATFEFGSDESGVTYQCSLNGGAFVPCSDPDTLTDLADGTYTLVVAAVDGAGNVDPHPPSYTWVVGSGSSASSSSSNSGSTSGSGGSSSASSGGSTSTTNSGASSGASSGVVSASTGTTNSTSGASSSGSTGSVGASTSSGSNGSSGTSGTHGGMSVSASVGASSSISSTSSGSGSTGGTSGSSSSGSASSVASSGSSGSGSTTGVVDPGTVGGGGCGLRGQSGGSPLELLFGLCAVALTRRKQAL